MMIGHDPVSFSSFRRQHFKQFKSNVLSISCVISCVDVGRASQLVVFATCCHNTQQLKHEPLSRTPTGNVCQHGGPNCQHASERQPDHHLRCAATVRTAQPIPHVGETLHTFEGNKYCEPPQPKWCRVQQHPMQKQRKLSWSVEKLRGVGVQIKGIPPAPLVLRLIFMTADDLDLKWMTSIGCGTQILHYAK